ncbi:MAG: YhjD/YihY/BrkB family envelope integrity protein [Gammaproteobacteria bacterium]|nr:YhjD/YihY/BrkB family envelope integrity protein [Gammaproteobacteria bacterium]
MQRLTDLKTNFQHLVWGEALSALTPWRARLVRMLRLFSAVVRDLGEGQLTLRAMSLVYTTLLSLVPLLALSFSVLKAFGVHNQIRPTLLAFLAPLGDKGAEITEQMLGFVSNIQVGVLGAIGLGLLLYTVTALLQKIELTFNYVWRVKHLRPLSQRFSQYLSVLTVGPLLVFSALGITAALMNSGVMQTLLAIEPFGTLIEITARLLPYLLVIAAFAMLYLLMPNTRVRFSAALTGATVAGVLWQSLGWGFAVFISTSTQYTAIYASFAIVIVSMIWLYLNWLIVLIGASIAFYAQYPAQLTTREREAVLSNRVKEKLALLIMTLIGRHFHTQQPAWSQEGLASRLNVPLVPVGTLLTALTRRGLLTETAQVPPCYLPARALETVTLRELLETVRSSGEETQLVTDGLPHEPAVDAVIARIDTAIDDALGKQTLRELTGTGEIKV